MILVGLFYSNICFFPYVEKNVNKCPLRFPLMLMFIFLFLTVIPIIVTPRP
jgi:hypothetical protein